MVQVYHTWTKDGIHALTFGQGAPMLAKLAAYIPTLQQLWGLLAVLAAAQALVLLGSGAGGRFRLPAADLFAGWGIATLVFTVVGVLVPTGFAVLGSVLLAVAGGVAGWRLFKRESLLPPGAARLLALMALVLLLVAAMLPSQWDEFSQWLYSVRYLIDVDGFPRRGGPLFPGSFAAYPFANGLPAYLAALVAGGFIEGAGALVGVLALAGFALLLAHLIDDRPGGPSWPVLAVAWLAATVLNPTFVPKIVFTAYADTATAVSLAVVAVLGWMALDAQGDGDRPRAKALALQAGLAAALLVSLKQANLVLFVLAVLALGLLALREPMVRLRECGGLAAALVLPAVVAYAAWRWHATGNFPGGEFAVRPVAQWSTDILPAIIARMGSVASNKGGHFGLLLVLTVLGLRGLVRMRSAFDRLALLAACIGVGYNLFLLFAYVTAFDRGEALSVASFWRYNMHVGGVTLVAAVAGLAQLWRHRGWRAPRAAAVAVVVLAALSPLAMTKYVRFDLRAPKQYVRAVSAQLAPMLPQGAKVALVDPLDPGFYVLLMKWGLHGRTDQVLRVYLGGPPLSEIERLGSRFAWVHTQDEAVRRFFGLPLPAGSSYLLARGETGGWSVLAEWPYPGYALPTDIRD
jgi:hypothetical protein